MPVLPDAVYVSRDVVVQPHDDGMLLVHVGNLSCHELDEVGASMWQALAECATCAEATDRLVSEYDVDRDTLERDLAEFVADLVDGGLVLLEPEPAPTPEGGVTVEGLRESYLDLVARSLCGITTAGARSGPSPATVKQRLYGTYVNHSDPSVLSMIGMVRMRNVRDLCERAIADGVPGDFMECGAWRGGVGIMMRAVLEAHGDPARRVWLADSFAGMPVVDLARFPVDEMWEPHTGTFVATADDVRRNVRAYGLLDDRVRLVEGWFKDTLPGAGVEEIAVLRLDGDLYESITDCLVALYDRVSPGGFVIVDDYCFEPARHAVEDFAASRGFVPDLVQVDWNAAWWRKPLS